MVPGSLRAHSKVLTFLSHSPVLWRAIRPDAVLTVEWKRFCRFIGRVEIERAKGSEVKIAQLLGNLPK